ncbi:phage integrase central domain-containing protein [Sphingomonas albertensis]|uniref:Integrase arm-type DNA-binding domain-containing protein n=1 Tax=Sphingomonas albertensis TaxID=2762591 RepID=A0ABR7ANH8_9SPHN|nr:integrase arm-type DNA-binding domain-containing protein [Sphingomonas albertensis]MBC3941999.1 integrase arm-type DNA-binding domain-containing protein [Sphingomonas albertensis]
MSGIKPTGKHLEKRLSAQAVRALNVPGLHGDGNGLYLKVRANGAKQWIQRIVIGDERRDLGLGSVTLVSLADAREKALENRKLARAGVDPLAAKKRSMEVLTFKAATEKVHELSKPTWRNDKHGDQWLNTLTTYAFPFFGSKRIDTVTGADVLAALSAIWSSHPETARRVKQRIGTVFKWAMANGWRADNPAETISKALPKHDRSNVKHRQALPYDAVEAAIATVRGSEAGTGTKLAFEFLVLTATRSGETREAVWSEFDLDKAVWTIPAARMKAKRLHRVPLPPRCIAILEEAQTLRRADDDLVFPGTKDKKPLSDMTLSKLMKELSIPAVPHGFRSSFRDWAGEQTNHPREVVEFALAHVIKDKAEAAYARSDLFDKRRGLMKDWCSYLCS